MRHLILGTAMALALSVTLTACKDNSTTDSSSSAVTVEMPTTAVLGSYGIATENMDVSVKPGDNFFHYVNGNWIENTEIPADKSSYGSFTILRDQSDERVKAIIEEAAASENPSADEQKVGAFYAAFMDDAARNAKGLSPIADDLATIAAVSSHSEALALMSNPKMGLEAPIGGWVDVDVKDTENYIFYLTQSGLGLPNKTYYFDAGDKSDELRVKYRDYLAFLLEKAGRADPVASADAVLAFETELAEDHWEPAKRRNRDLTYNKMSLDEMKADMPGFDWDAMLTATGLDQDTFVVREKDAIEGMAETFAKTDIDTLKDYMAAHLISGFSAYLPQEIDQASFDFYGTALRGTEEQRPRWKRAVSQIDGTMGEVVGKIYVERHFPPAAKAQMDDLIENLRAAFREGIDNLEWMEEETKAQAQDKLAKFNPKIGYPEEWTDYSALQVDADDLIGSVKSSRQWQWDDMVSKLGGPIDRGEWGMNPQTVNAYYRPSLNEIVFPAAILQAPFFDPNADPAVNYGGIGAVIGHEMGHGFDDQGRKSDGDGVQRDWWTEGDAERYEALAGALADQYSAFEPLPGEFLDGQLGLGENIGDLTGITMAYDAYKRSLNGKEAPVIDGMTGDQRFFLAYGQIWQRKWREEALRNQIKTGPHSPGEYRANGIVRNFDPWYEAFDVGPDDALYLSPEERVKIW